MAIQPENKIFPHVVPQAPDSEDELLDWAKSESSSMEELTRQVVDKYNSHIDQTHAHPKSWPVLRIPRPSFKSKVSDTSQLIVPASTAIPARFVIGEKLYEIYSDLTLDLDTSGVGGLRTGLSKAANTIYYLYTVVSGSSVGLIADTNAPSTGVSGYTVSTYLGAFATIAGAAIAQFVSHRGKFISPATIQEQSHTGDTALTALTVRHPVTAKFGIGTAKITGTVAGGTNFVTGFNDSTNATHSVVLQVNGIENHNTFEVELDSPTTVYVRTGNAANTAYWRVLGWIEDPTEWN